MAEQLNPFSAINGWTKEKMKAQIRKYNNGSKAMRDGVCTFQNDDGNRCAVGCFIPDGHPGLQVQGSALELIATYPELAKVMPLAVHLDDLNSSPLLDLQQAHDFTINDPSTVYERVDAWIDANVQDP